MQLASINFDGEKKKPSGYIIPASYFKSKNVSEVKTIKPNSSTIETTTPDVEEVEKTQPIKAFVSKIMPPIPVIHTTKKTCFRTLIKQYSKEKRTSDKTNGSHYKGGRLTKRPVYRRRSP